MTNTELIQKIRDEIERRIKLYSITNEKEQWIVNTYWSVLSFLSTIETEKPIEELEEELEKEINKAMKSDLCPEEISNYDFCCIARHFAQWGAEHLKK